jgi:hypothetical protein
MRQLRVPLSSPWTPVFKFGFPAIWIAACLGLIVAREFSGRSVTVAELWAFILATPLILWYSGGVLQVHQQGSTLVISNYRREERIPADQIEAVTRFWWARPGSVTIRFRGRTSFGRTISFLPEETPLSMIGLGWLDEEPAEHLRELAGRAAERMPSS